MAGQKASGMAYEYAVAHALQQMLGSHNINLLNSDVLTKAKQCYYDSASHIQAANLTSASNGVAQMLKFEPVLLSIQAGRVKGEIVLQSDQAGIAGDVRDIIVRTDGGEVGISAKHEHQALKHSRLSSDIDFGNSWFGIKNSAKYFDSINPTFSELGKMREQGVRWREVSNKASKYYRPVLEAFKTEMLELEHAHNPNVAPHLISYLIGKHDFYKIIKKSKNTIIQVFNFNGTLNEAFEKQRAEIHLPRLKLPTRIVELDFKRTPKMTSNTTLSLILDEGWHLSLRIHSARTQVEPSLKFDIGLVGRPNNLNTFFV